MRLLTAFISFAFVALVVGTALILGLFAHYNKDLPDYTYLKDYQPPTLTRIYADDGRMMATIAEEQRIFVPIKAIPKRVIDAFISAEDEDFYQHGGVDYEGVARAMIVNLKNVGHDRRPMGASTITQQVAKNMLLTNEVSIERKVKEAILATKLEKVLTKDRILEIYLNEIFLGHHSYGVAAAALNYFNKSLDELTIADAAYLAALPKAPNSYDPVRDHDAAIGRRAYVLERMQVNGYITAEDKMLAEKEPLETHVRDSAETVTADYFAEEVRRQLIAQFGDDDVLDGGLAVKTSLDSKLQDEATKALRDGLISFDRRERGWRGPVAHLTNFTDWQKSFKKIATPAGGEEWPMALVIGLKENEAQIAFVDNRRATIPWSEMKWARREYANDQFGPPVRRPADVLAVGDVVLVEEVKKGEDGKSYPADTYTLRQVPVVQGAIVVLDPNTGRVRAMNGGFSTRMSQFNRATQAERQPGSSFKPFVYMAALDKGFTPSSLILDAPFEYFQGPGLPLWRPENYEQNFEGPTPLRVGIEKSRNVMTVRLANAIGMPTVIDYAKKFGVVDDMPNLLSFALGAKETTPLRMVTAYGMIVNGGRKIAPSLIDRVEDRDGHTVWRADQRECKDCDNVTWTPDLAAPDIPDTREQVEDPRTAYQMVSIMEGVVQRGTGKALRDVGFPLAGKTGTTSESKDAWFIGFTPDMVCGVYVGFDDPKPLGSHETGATVAVPIFKEFITNAMKDTQAVPFRVPPGLRMVRISASTGALAEMGDKDAIWEAYIPGTEPEEGQPRPVLDGSVTGSAASGAAGAYAPTGTSTPMAEEAPPDETDMPPVIIDSTTSGQPKAPSAATANTSTYDSSEIGGAGPPGVHVTPVTPPSGVPMSPSNQIPPAQSAAPPSTLGTGGLY